MLLFYFLLHRRLLDIVVSGLPEVLVHAAAALLRLARPQLVDGDKIKLDVLHEVRTGVSRGAYSGGRSIH